MMLPDSVENLINEFAKLPGIGPKTAARLVFYLLTKPDHDIENLGNAVLELKKNLHFCKVCFNIATTEVCRICEDDKRNQSQIAVVEEPLDLIAFEKSGYLGVYHVLGGAISPIEGVGPENLRISQLISRLKNRNIKEVILATDPDFEGEATSAYIKDKISQANIKTEVTRIARGLPVGSNLEYADEVTIKRSIEGRREY
ncbi:MAG: recombination mediator RecR [Patescibacteria group bacterium]